MYKALLEILRRINVYKQGYNTAETLIDQIEKVAHNGLGCVAYVEIHIINGTATVAHSPAGVVVDIINLGDYPEYGNERQYHKEGEW